MITRSIFAYRLKAKFPHPTSNQTLILELTELVKCWENNYCSNELTIFFIKHIRLNKKYHEATVKKIFSQLGLNVIRVNRKTGKHKTIIHFEPFCDEPQ